MFLHKMRRHIQTVALATACLAGTMTAHAQSAPATAPGGSASAQFQPVRETLSLDRGWFFNEGDIPFPTITGHQSSYNNAKAGKAWGAADPAYNDTAWKSVDLPHDWAVEQPFDQKANISQGYRAHGIGWYRKYFQLDQADHGKSLELQLDGVATHCDIWVNGVIAYHNFCGYTGMNIDITPYAKFGSALNVVAVRVDAVAQEGWWYEGAGIYRHTWLPVVPRSAIPVPAARGGRAGPATGSAPATAPGATGRGPGG